MPILTLDLEDDYALIGIHSTEEDYRMAFLLNKHLNTRLTRFKHALDFKDSTAEFPLFEYKDVKNYINYYLINNQHLQHINNPNSTVLFEDENTVTYLIPEKKNIDFFLKIEGCNDAKVIEKLVEKLNKIEQIITSYSLDPASLKSKDHLIF